MCVNSALRRMRAIEETAGPAILLIDTDMNVETLATQEGQQFAAGLSTFGRWGQPTDVADIAAFLASDDSRWVTGQIIDASGGSRL